MGVSVLVLVGVFVEVFVPGGVIVAVSVLVGVFVEVLVGMLVRVFEGVPVGVLVGVSLGVFVGVGVLLGVLVLVGVLLGVFVGVGVLLGVSVDVLVGVTVGVLVAVLVGVFVGVRVAVDVGVSVGVLVGGGAQMDVAAVWLLRLWPDTSVPTILIRYHRYCTGMPDSVKVPLIVPVPGGSEPLTVCWSNTVHRPAELAETSKNTVALLYGIETPHCRL
jgi:hypothetical protein